MATVAVRRLEAWVVSKGSEAETGSSKSGGEKAAAEKTRASGGRRHAHDLLSIEVAADQ